MKRLWHFISILNRARRIAQCARDYYDAVVHHCCGVSNANNELAFIVERVGIFGGPVITQITRPDEVRIGEFEGVVIIKDGFLYELKKSRS